MRLGFTTFSQNPKDKSMEWKHLLFFWNAKRPILEHYLEKRYAIIFVGYSKMLANKLKWAIHTKSWIPLSKCYCCMTMHAHTIETIENWVLCFQNILPAVQILLFWLSSLWTRQTSFTSVDLEKEQEAVHKWLYDQPKAYSNGTRSLWTSGRSAF